MSQNLDLPIEGFVRPAHVARAFGVCRSTVDNMVRSGILPQPQKCGRIVRWPVSAIRQALKESGGSVRHEVYPNNQPTPAS